MRFIAAKPCASGETICKCIPGRSSISLADLAPHILETRSRVCPSRIFISCMRAVEPSRQNTKPISDCSSASLMPVTAKASDRLIFVDSRRNLMRCFLLLCDVCGHSHVCSSGVYKVALCQLCTPFLCRHVVIAVRNWFFFLCFDFVPFVGDPRECRGYVAFPPICGPSRSQG